VAGTVSAKTVRAVLGVAQGMGLDPRALASRHGVTEAMSDIDARFPHAAWLGMWEDLERDAGGAAVGIRAAERLPFGHWDVIDYLLSTSETLEVGLRRFERYFAIISTGATHTLERKGDDVLLVRRYADVAVRLLAPTEFAFAATLSHLRMVLGFHFRPREVRFASPAPSNDTEHRRFFDCPVVFGAATSVIVIDRASLSLPMHNPEPELGLMLERHAEQLVGRLGARDESLEARVRLMIVRGMPDGDVSLDGAARRLGTSARTLQRRLSDEGLSFDALLDGTRRDLARQYLGDPALSIQETAHLLAFGDLRGFYRAFKRWEGVTPADFRRARASSSPQLASRP
jgi:AraC-like DNA-binding protein